MTSQAPSLPRVVALGSALADQIAAGEVVERPASIVKELVDNAIDAGARRIDVRLQAGGVESIVVVDDGHGIHPEDLRLALTRHATSKLRRAEDLIEIRTLGFRGEALASVAAVARVRLGSRRRGEPMGRWAVSRPGGPVQIEPAGMAVGTRVEISDLFGTVPARRKFLRAEATEVGHVAEAIVRLALVHPAVRFSLVHGRRTLVELSPTEDTARVRELLLRRGGADPTRHVRGEHEGVTVQAWLMRPSPTVRRGAGVWVVVRRRVVREPNLSKLVAAAYGDALAPGQHPVACVWVDPPSGEVDVNVHPQKSEIRFGDPQRVYAAVREVLQQLEPPTPEPVPTLATTRPSLAAALGEWSDKGATAGGGLPAAAAGPGSPPSPRPPGSSYRLGTRAASAGYAQARDALRQQASDLGGTWSRARALDRASGEPAGSAAWGAATPGSAPMDPATSDSSSQVAQPPCAEAPAEPVFLTCLPGPVGLFRDGDDLVAVDLRALRAHLVYRRLKEDLGGEGIGAQGLLQPSVVPLPAADVAVVGAQGAGLRALGLWIEPFGDEAIVVRAVPAQLRRCIEDLDVADLVRRVLPWLRVRGSSRPATEVAAGPAAPPDADAIDDAMRAFAEAEGPDPAPRLARTWIRELVQMGERLDGVAGVHRYRATDLVRGRK